MEGRRGICGRALDNTGVSRGVLLITANSTSTNNCTSTIAEREEGVLSTYLGLTRRRTPVGLSAPLQSIETRGCGRLAERVSNTQWPLSNRFTHFGAARRHTVDDRPSVRGQCGQQGDHQPHRARFTDQYRYQGETDHAKAVHDTRYTIHLLQL